jgi:sugar phosphate isomerase/epimerase
MALQISALIAPGLPAERVMANIAGFDHADLVRGLTAHGFTLFELNGDLGYLLPQAYTPAAVERLAALKAELGLSYTVHLPLWSVEPASPVPGVRQGSVQALVDTIRATRLLDPEMYVMHATGSLAAEFYRMRLPELARVVLLRQFQGHAHQSLQAILAESGLPSRQLAIETVEFPFDLTVELAEELDLSLCFDTGHVLVGFSGPVDFFAALDRCLPRLGEIHLHDGPRRGPGEAPGYGLDHHPLGTGDLDLPRFLARLEQAGFSGPIIFELGVEEALASLDVIRAAETSEVF